ncbi:porin [Actibacterium ureilyticum]|uniref:porin n=1 Tax=Actibacterium ureilyticum TaxID=1590614 RepID=UPI000BAAC2C2|nr:porin [Actibacterium ureilyticum]
MKKVLFATTALVASASIAAAEAEFGLSAEMGVTGGDRYGEDNDDLSFHNDFTISFDGSSETDNGITFGLHVEIEESNGARAINGSGFSFSALESTTATTATEFEADDVQGATFDNESVYISGAFGTLTLGEIDGAFDKSLTEIALAAGSIADDETEHAGFNGNSGLDGSEDNQILRYDYSFDTFGFSISAEQDDDGAESDDIYGVGATFGLELAGLDLNFGLGYQTNGDDEVIGLSIHSAFDNGFEAVINYSTLDLDEGADEDYIGVGIGYTMDALSFGLNYGEFDVDGGDDRDGFGLAVNYDLGGGAVVQFGYGDGEDLESYSLGIAMSF